MSVLVDSSVWIDYFRGKGDTGCLDKMLDDGLVVTNELILAELIPPLKNRKHNKLVSLLGEMEKITLRINWEEITNLQLNCIKHGINKIGIPDLIIAQNAMQYKVPLYSCDKHFVQISRHTHLSIYPVMKMG